MITIYSSFAVVNDEDVGSLAGCGSILYFEDEFNRIVRREFGFYLGSSNVGLAKVNSLRLPLNSILNRKLYDVVLHINDDFLFDLVDRSNLDFVVKFRNELKNFKNVRIVLLKEDNNDFVRSMEIATNAAIRQINYATDN